jgi:hypothetical protein
MGRNCGGFDSMLDVDRSDARVRSAIAHWAPRFVGNGVALTDFEEVTAQVQTWDQWCQAWSARAAVHESAGQALAREKYLSAGEHLQRLGVYYHFAKFLFVNDLTQMRCVHMKTVECRWSVSPGGYYAPRAAALGLWIKACIAFAGPYNWSEAWDGLPEITREAFRVRSQWATKADARRHAATLTLKGVTHNITRPIFIITGKLDRIIPWQHAERLARGQSAGRVDDYRGRQSRRQQARLSLACAGCGLDGGATGMNPRRKVTDRAIRALRNARRARARRGRLTRWQEVEGQAGSSAAQLAHGVCAGSTAGL